MKSVLITGASSGFGELTAKTLAARGYRVFASMRDVGGRNAGPARALDRWAADTGFALEAIEMDVTDDASVAGAVAQVATAAGQVDILINNAGVSAGGPLEAYSLDLLREVYEINAFGPVRVDKAVLPAMRERRDGVIIHVTSTLGRIAIPMSAPYVSSKAAMEVMADCLHYELKPWGIDAVIFEPGQYDTPAMSKRVAADLGEVIAAYEMFPRKRPVRNPAPGDPQEIADALADLVQMPQFTRPLRTTVGTHFAAGVRELNAAYEANRRVFWESLGLEP